jgi:hypothetical protein
MQDKEQDNLIEASGPALGLLADETLEQGNRRLAFITGVKQTGFVIQTSTYTLTPFKVLKNDIEHQWSRLSQYCPPSQVEARLEQMAFHNLPTHVPAIVDQWNQMGADAPGYKDRWKKTVSDIQQQTIPDLMRIDLSIYYTHCYKNLRADILEHKIEKALGADELMSIAQEVHEEERDAMLNTLELDPNSEPELGRSR